MLHADFKQRAFDLLHTVAALAVAAIAVLGLARPAVAAPCEDPAPRTARRSFNLGSGFDLPILPNLGHLAPEISHAAPGLVGASFLFHHDGAVTIRFEDGESATLRFSEAPPAELEAVSPLAWTTRLISAAGTSELPGFAALDVAELGDGLHARHRARSRQLRTTWSGDFASLALRLDELVESRVDDASASLELILPSGRVLRLHAARGAENAEGVESRIRWIEQDGALVLDPQALAAALPDAEFEVVLDVAPYSHAYDAVEDGQGGVIAFSSTVAAAAASGADLAVARFDGEGALAGLTLVAGPGEERPVAITAQSDGTVVLVAVTDAPGLPVEGVASFDAAVGAEPFVLRLADDGLLLGGRYLEGDGLESVHDVAVDGEGRLLISGRAASQGAPIDPVVNAPLAFTAVLPIQEGAPTVRYVLVELDAELAATGRGGEVEGDDAGIRLELTTSCLEPPRIGPKPTLVAQGACTPGLVTDTYPDAGHPFPAPSVFHDGFVDAYADAWGHHALRWKAATQPAHAYSPHPNAPFLIVYDTDAARLDNIERDPFVFATEPAGSWIANTSLSAFETALGTALYMDFWHSPAYTNLKLAGQYQAKAVALMEVEFCVDPAGSLTRLVDYCALTALNLNITANRYPIDGVDLACANAWGGGTLLLRQVTIDRWDFDNFLQGVVLPGPTFTTAWADATYSNQTYIADPPDGHQAAGGHVEEITGRLVGEMEQPIAARVYSVEGGEASLVDEGSALLAVHPAIFSEIR